LAVIELKVKGDSEDRRIGLLEGLRFTEGFDTLDFPSARRLPARGRGGDRHRDDTIERRWGAKIKARGIYRDPVRSSLGHFVKASGLQPLLDCIYAHQHSAGYDESYGISPHR
jgi:hypothetical protein